MIVDPANRGLRGVPYEQIYKRMNLVLVMARPHRSVLLQTMLCLMGPMFPVREFRRPRRTARGRDYGRRGPLGDVIRDGRL